MTYLLPNVEAIRKAAFKDKPCPFCGEDPPPVRKSGGPGLLYIVECCNEDCYAKPSVYGATIAQAWERWNGRC